jgi:dihydrofolate synthase/folylpolyglutamate synthase
MNYSDTIDALNRCGMHTIKPGLERMQTACERLGHPERAVKCVHVAGTNGKGSTIAFLESLLRANGCRVGRYTSPHLHDVRERIVTHGQMISEAEWMQAFERVQEKCADLQPSYFEYLTLMAFVHFRDHPVDVLLLETGMGGRWDATNVVTPLVSILTTIDYDHQAYLGNTLAQIAAEKCGILKPNVPAVIAPQAPAVMDVIQTTVAELGIHAQIVPPLSKEIPLGLAGEHQRQNAALAVAAARVIKDAVIPAEGSQLLAGTPDLESLAHVRWPGRLEWISQDPPILCDVAHNPGGMRVLVDCLKSQFPKGEGNHGSVTVLLGVMSDKDAGEMLRVLAEIAETFYCVTPNTTRALPADDLAQLVRAAGKTAVVTTIADVKKTWKGLAPLVVTGSFFTVGEYKKLC